MSRKSPSGEPVTVGAAGGIPTLIRIHEKGCGKRKWAVKPLLRPTVRGSRARRRLLEATLKWEINGDVSSDVKERIEEAYMNDEQSELVVTRLTSDSDRIVVEMRTPHGDETHTRRFDAPERGSLKECPKFVEFLDGIGVSPLNLDDIAGQRVPARFDDRRGWVIDESRLSATESAERTSGTEDETETVSRTRSRRRSFSRPQVSMPSPPTKETVRNWCAENKMELIAATAIVAKCLAIVVFAIAAA